MLQTKIIFIYKFVWIIIFSFSPQNSCFNQMYRLSNMINMKHPAIHLNPTLSVLKIATVEQGAHHQKQQNGRATSTLKTSYSLASYFLLAILSARFSLCGRALWYTWSKKNISPSVGLNRICPGHYGARSASPQVAKRQVPSSTLQTSYPSDIIVLITIMWRPTAEVGFIPLLVCSMMTLGKSSLI